MKLLGLGWQKIQQIKRKANKSVGEQPCALPLIQYHQQSKLMLHGCGEDCAEVSEGIHEVVQGVVFILGVRSQISG